MLLLRLVNLLCLLLRVVLPVVTYARHLLTAGNTLSVGIGPLGIVFEHLLGCLGYVDLGLVLCLFHALGHSGIFRIFLGHLGDRLAVEFSGPCLS